MIYVFDRVETLWKKKKKMLVTSIFSFSHDVFKGSPFQGHQNLELCGKE